MGFFSLGCYRNSSRYSLAEAEYRCFFWRGLILCQWDFHKDPIIFYHNFLFYEHLAISHKLPDTYDVTSPIAIPYTSFTFTFLIFRFSSLYCSIAAIAASENWKSYFLAKLLTAL